MTRPVTKSGETRRYDRRTALKTIGTGLFATGLSGTALAQDGFPPTARTDWGKPQRLGAGTAATFLTTGDEGRARYLGIWFTAEALEALPEDADEAPSHITTLPLPAVASSTPFEWVAVDWNPEGHIPEAVYDVPHFDFHFYFADQETVEQRVPPGECDADGDGTVDFDVPCAVQETGTKPLPQAQKPPGYVSTQETVPVMGDHWVDPNAPEFTGEPFTYTWIWGSFDGQLWFMEPMVSAAFLRELRGKVQADISMPAAFPEAGRYPTRYVVRYLRNQDAYAVVLRNFRQFDAS
ncbi:DUF5602 domain-containing protein [Halorussus halophilus]|uniref:DUF5602 domain-containing protein n=1 Tax=Halorussus halophilus TaxID=2650975 RepID=UPI001300D0E2|nr:DUF5602 domain-containing protein [Halorussus halophilus]